MSSRPSFGIEPLERRALLAANINGVVFDDANANARRDAGEGGVPNQRVFIDLNFDGRFQNNEPSTLTNAGGAYTLPDRPNGIQRVRYQLPTGRRQTAPAALFFDVAVVGSTVNNINFGSTANGIIRGSVFADENGNGRRDSGDRGLAGWTVFIDKDNDGRLDRNEKSRLTDSNGAYRFAGLPAGTYRVRVVQQPGFRATIPAAGVRSVPLAAGQSLSNRNFGQDQV